MHCFYISDLNVSYTAETKNLTSWWVDHRPHIVQLLYLTNVQNAQGHLVPRGPRQEPPSSATPGAAGPEALIR